MRIQAFPISFPPRRFIGAELMSAQLLRALQDAGHKVGVHVGDGFGVWQWDGLHVSGSALDIPRGSEVAVVHAGRSWPGVEYRQKNGARLVMVCHNLSDGAREDLEMARPDLVVVNSQTMRDDLGVDALVIHPPAPPVTPLPAGDHVVALSLNKMKGGPQVLALAAMMPHRKFLAVRSGYGEQARTAPSNVDLLDHVPHGDLAQLVWSQASVFLQLSSEESWGMAAAEALAHGVPVIAHPTPGLLENLGDAVRWVDRDNTAELAAAVDEVIGHPGYRAAALRRATDAVQVSRTQVAEWVTAIERLGHGSEDQRNGAAPGVLAERV